LIDRRARHWSTALLADAINIGRSLNKPLLQFITSTWTVAFPMQQLACLIAIGRCADLLEIKSVTR